MIYGLLFIVFFSYEFFKPRFSFLCMGQVFTYICGIDKDNFYFKGITSKSNIGLWDADGKPLPMEHTISIFKDRPHVTDDCQIIEIEENELQAYLDKNINAKIKRDENGLKISKICTENDDWDSLIERNCTFGLPPNILKTNGKIVGNKSTFEIPSTINNRLTPHGIITLNGLNPTSYRDVAYATFVNRWKDRLSDLNITIDKSRWDKELFTRFKEWKDRVGKEPMKTVSLLTHVLVPPAALNPRGILDYGMEIECNRYHTCSDFFTVSHEDRPGGPWEISTHPYNDEYGLFDELSNYHFTQHGQGPNTYDVCGKYTSCGSHIHIKPPEQDIHLYFRLYRVLVGMYAPFFSGTETEKNEDFRFRQIIDWWANPPPQLTLDDIRNWGQPDSLYGHDGYNKTFWIAPHTVSSHNKSKDMTIEFRLNEGHATAAITAIRSMARIGDAFASMKYTPKFTDDSMILARKTIKYNNGLPPLPRATPNEYPISYIDEIQTKLTDDPQTAEILSKVFETDIAPGKSVALKDLLRQSIKTMPMKGYEKWWINNVLGNVTWGKMLNTIPNLTDQINLTNACFTYRPTTYNVDLNRTSAIDPRDEVHKMLANFQNTNYKLTKDAFPDIDYRPDTDEEFWAGRRRYHQSSEHPFGRDTTSFEKGVRKPR